MTTSNPNPQILGLVFSLIGQRRARVTSDCCSVLRCMLQSVLQRVAVCCSECCTCWTSPSKGDECLWPKHSGSRNYFNSDLWSPAYGLHCLTYCVCKDRKHMFTSHTHVYIAYCTYTCILHLHMYTSHTARATLVNTSQTQCMCRLPRILIYWHTYSVRDIYITKDHKHIYTSHTHVYITYCTYTCILHIHMYTLHIRVYITYLAYESRILIYWRIYWVCDVYMYTHVYIPRILCNVYTEYVYWVCDV